MKMSQINKAVRLINDRRITVCLLDNLAEGEDIEIAVGGYPADVSDAVLQAVADSAAELGLADLARIEAELVALGIEIDVPRDAYRHTEFPHEDDDDEMGGVLAA